MLVKILLLTLSLHSLNAAVEQVDDTDLIHLLTREDNVVALFTKSKCPECSDWETVVENVQNDLKDSLNAVVVKAHNSHLINIYDPSKEPSLVFFRKGIPLLYYGERNEEEIVQTFIDNRDPVVKELSDENFEHLTQAASGATTGDWFVFFYSADCVLCQRLYAVWEGVGAKLRRQLNVARVNRKEAGISTANRFRVTESPEFLYIRLGKVYPYKSLEYTPKSFIEFVETGYKKQTHPEPVPPVASLIDDFVSSRLRSILINPQLLILSSIILTLIVILFLIIKCLSKKKNGKKEKKAKKVR